MKNFKWLGLCCLTLFFSCKSLPFETLTLSQGGGFIGNETRYVVNKKGVVIYFESMKDEGTKLGKLSHGFKGEVKTLYHLIKQFPEIDEPSNRTRRIIVKDTTGIHEYVWSLDSNNSYGYDAVYNFISNIFNSIK